MRTRRHLSALALVFSFTVNAHAAPPKIIPDIATSKDVGSGPVAAPGGGLLAKAARCAAIPEAGALPEDCMDATTRGVFGTSSDGASYLLFGPKTLSSCAGYEDLTIERTTVVKGKLSEPEILFRHRGCEEDESKDPDACPKARQRAIWTALAKLAKEGYQDLPNLAGARMESEAGIQAARPVAVLGAPFEGWMLYLKDERKRSKILLVDPSNTKAIAIGHRLCSEVEPYPDAPDDEYLQDCYGSIVHAALTADRKALVLSTTYHDGGHCSPHELNTTRYWLPKEAQAIIDASRPESPGVNTAP